MTKTVDYYFATLSPFAYLGSRMFDAIVDRHDLGVNVRPVDLGQIFGKTGGLPLPKRAPERQAYRLQELKRWRDYLDMPLVIQPDHFPTDATLSSLMVAAAVDQGLDARALAHAIMAITWADNADMADETALTAAAAKAGIDGAALIEAARAGPAEKRLQAFTDEALAAGVFGAPTYIYEGELFWGQDRLEFLERAVA